MRWKSNEGRDGAAMPAQHRVPIRRHQDCGCVVSQPRSLQTKGSWLLDPPPHQTHAQVRRPVSQHIYLRILARNLLHCFSAPLKPFFSLNIVPVASHHSQLQCYCVIGCLSVKTIIHLFLSESCFLS